MPAARARRAARRDLALGRPHHDAPPAPQSEGAGRARRPRGRALSGPPPLPRKSPRAALQRRGDHAKPPRQPARASSTRSPRSSGRISSSALPRLTRTRRAAPPGERYANASSTPAVSLPLTHRAPAIRPCGPLAVALVRTASMTRWVQVISSGISQRRSESRSARRASSWPSPFEARPSDANALPLLAKEDTCHQQEQAEEKPTLSRGSRDRL